MTNSERRYLIITPYYKEERRLLERCIGSVKMQTITVDHLLVADGFPQDWIDSIGDLRHLRLDRAHGDYGNTPRGVGALLAICEGYDGFCFCDADNWLEPQHVAACLEVAKSFGDECDYVIARRFMRRPDESIMSIADEPIDAHVDTNCFFFLPGAYHATHLFTNIPKELAGLGDRLFYKALRGQPLTFGVVAEPTVNYHNMWAPIYQAAGEIPPEGAKPHIDEAAMHRWLASRSPRERAIVSRRTGLQFS